MNAFTDSNTGEHTKATYDQWISKLGVNSMSGVMGLGQKMGEDIGALDNAINRIKQLKAEGESTGTSLKTSFD
jgi:hypothetical protein